MRMQRLRQQARDCQHQRPHTLQPRSAPRTAPSAPSQRNSISPLCCAASPSGVESAAAEPQTHAVLSPPAEAELHPSAQLASQSPDPQGNESPCQPSESSSAVASPTRRATCAAAAAVALQAALPAQPAQALKTVTLKDGSEVQVFEHGMSLSIVGLRGSIPQDWILEFKMALGKYAGFTLGQRTQISEIYKELSDPPDTKNSCSQADVVTLGDAWLAPAIKAGLIQPILNADKSRWWRWLSPRWQSLIRRDSQGRPSATGDVYAAPYRWGLTLIAYRRDRVLAAGGHDITDWCDLLQPQLQGRVAMTDSSREFIGAALKAATVHRRVPASATAPARTVLGSPSQGSGSGDTSVGFNACSRSLAARGIGAAELAEACRALRKQVKLFSSRDHIRAFSAGDVHVVVGWSQDIITLAERSSAVEAVVPLSGTALFADLWVVPSGAKGGHMQQGPSPILPAWIEFGLQPARVLSLNGLKTGASPLLLDYPMVPSNQRDKTPPDTVSAHDGALVQYDSGYFPLQPVGLDRSEFLLPLDEDTRRLYSDALAMLQTTNQGAGAPSKVATG